MILNHIIFKMVCFKHRKSKYFSKYDEFVKLYRDDYAIFKNEKYYKNI